MAHVSGNPTWLDYPALDTPITAPALEAAETAIDNAPQAARPVCEARLTTNYTSLAGNTWLGMRGQMSATVDPFSMFANAAPTTNLYTMAAPTGWPGRYWVYWQFGHDGTVAGGTNAIGVVLLNCPPATVNASISTYTELRNQGAGFNPACTGEVVLAAGGTVSFGVHVAQAGAWNMQIQSSTILVRTRAIMRYVGPA